MVSGKRKASAKSSDAALQVRLGGCRAGAALRGAELVGRHIVLLGSDQHFTNVQVVDWAARKVLAMQWPRAYFRSSPARCTQTLQSAAIA